MLIIKVLQSYRTNPNSISGQKTFVFFHFIRELIVDKQLAARIVRLAEQKVDIMTRALLKAKHEDMVMKIGLLSNNANDDVLKDLKGR
jgi:hypothetical protein